MERPRASGMNRISSRNHLISEGALAYQEALFKKRYYYPEERRKYPEEEQLINAISLLMKDEVKKYGGTYLPLKADHFAILSGTGEKNLGGYYGRDECAKIFEENVKNSADFAVLVAHEGFHFQSYQSMTIDSTEMRSQRLGLTLFNKRNEELMNVKLNEAMTEELTKRFIQKYGKNLPHVKDYFKYLSSIKKKFKPEVAEDLAIPIITELNGERSFDGNAMSHVYREERKELWQVIDGIVEKSGGKMGREKVFEVFARAYFTKDMSKLSKLVNDTYGRGKFKELLMGNMIEKDPIDEQSVLI